MTASVSGGPYYPSLGDLIPATITQSFTNDPDRQSIEAHSGKMTLRWNPPIGTGKLGRMQRRGGPL